MALGFWSFNPKPGPRVEQCSRVLKWARARCGLCHHSAGPVVPSCEGAHSTAAAVTPLWKLMWKVQLQPCLPSAFHSLLSLLSPGPSPGGFPVLTLSRGVYFCYLSDTGALSQPLPPLAPTAAVLFLPAAEKMPAQHWKLEHSHCAAVPAQACSASRSSSSLCSSLPLLHYLNHTSSDLKPSSLCSLEAVVVL